MVYPRSKPSVWGSPQRASHTGEVRAHCPEDTTKNVQKIALVAIIATTVAITGCAGTPVGGRDYTTSQVRTQGSVRDGVILAMREVKIHEAKSGWSSTSNIGGIVGGAIGAAAGAAFVKDSTYRYVAGTVGAALGAVAGSQLTTMTSAQTGIELDIRLSTGERIIATQGADETFTIGQRVRVTHAGGAYRVTA